VDLETFGLPGRTQSLVALADLVAVVLVEILLACRALLVERVLPELMDLVAVAEVQAITQQIQPMVDLEL
jgi:hypothetical protein